MCCTSKACRTTHALIPSFSVPCCSTGMDEVDLFLAMRKNGATISEAGQCFVDAGMSPDYPEFIHRKFKRTVSRLSAVFESTYLPPSNYPDAIFSLCREGTVRPVSELNENCRLLGFNPVCFSRSNILLLPKFKVRTVISHNPPCQGEVEAGRVQRNHPLRR